MQTFTDFLSRLITGAIKPSMPPKDEPKPTADEIALGLSDGAATGQTWLDIALR